MAKRRRIINILVEKEIEDEILETTIKLGFYDGDSDMIVEKVIKLFKKYVESDANVNFALIEPFLESISLIETLAYTYDNLAYTYDNDDFLSDEKRDQIRKFLDRWAVPVESTNQ